MKIFLLLTLFLSTLSLAVRPDLKNLPIGLAPFEKDLINRGETPPLTKPPVGPVRSLAEWETSIGVMTLWTNPSLLRALSEHGPVKLLADSRSDQSWWLSYLEQQGIDSSKFTFYQVPTDSIWVRDYGPWFILDGNATFGLIDTKYNRPRPKDDLVPLYVAKQLGIPYYQPGLVHTGGNYYNDALGNAFSSTLVYSENSTLTPDTVNTRMHDYLGINRYTTSRLSPGTTIQHLDTFGKLVTPDTWVFSEFPETSPHKKDSDEMVARLRKLKSPYGTPYKIFRMKMVGQGNNFRAYINSFISNRALYYPAYGDETDEVVRKIYQEALPSYDIVPVDAQGTTWGDSVHCRTRNLLTDKTVFIFPNLSTTNEGIELNAEIIPSPGAVLATEPTVHWSLNGEPQSEIKMVKVGGRFYRHVFKNLSSGSILKTWISAKDTAGYAKTEPHGAPELQIEMKVE